MTFRPSRARVLACALAPAALAVSTRLSAQDLPVLNVAVDPFDSYAEGYYAQDLGLFTKAGLDVRLQTFMNGAAITIAVTGGDADIGISNPVTLALAFSRGLPFTLIAGAGMYSSRAPTTLLCVAAGSPIQSAKDFEGKTIGVGSLKDISSSSTEVWLQKNGAAVSTLKYAEIPYNTMGPALKRGTIDAAVLIEPAMTAAEGRGEIRTFARIYDAIAPEFLIGTFFTTTPFLKKSPDLVRKFVGAIYEAGRWANANQSASADILGKYAKMAPETTHKMRRVLYAKELTARLVQPELDLAFKTGILEKSVSAGDMIARF
jgi:NitT/TauT family transport system substrate-binding protein